MIWDPGKKYRHMWTTKARMRNGKLLEKLHRQFGKWLENHPSPVKRKGKKHG